MPSDLDHAIARYLRQRLAEGLSPGTGDHYRYLLTGMASFLASRGVLRVADAVAADLDAYAHDLETRGWATATRQGFASCARDFFRRLQADGLVLRNPALEIAIPDEDEEELPEAPLDEAEVQRLLDQMPRGSVLDLRHRLVVELLYSCGLRLGEAVGLNLDDLDLDAHQVLVRGEGEHDRHVPLMRGVLGAVRDYLTLRRTLLRGPDHGALLLDRYGQRLAAQNVRHLLRRLERWYLPHRHLHPHLFRHSIAVHLLRGGADVRYIQQFLGHVDINTTKVYLRLVPGHLRQAYDRAMPVFNVAT